jgi:hypothetical protein
MASWVVKKEVQEGLKKAKGRGRSGAATGVAPLGNFGSGMREAYNARGRTRDPREQRRLLVGQPVGHGPDEGQLEVLAVQSAHRT